MMQENAFSGEDHEDPSIHLTRVNDICEVVGPKNLPKDFFTSYIILLVFKRQCFQMITILTKEYYC
jgi:hypothetical protein